MAPATGTRYHFFSDNTASVCPELMQALAAANSGFAVAYGDDPWTARLDAVLSDFFGTRVRAFPMITGTAANATALATLVPPWGAVFCHPEAHINRDECGAPTFFSGGAQLSLLPGAHGRLEPAALAEAIAGWPFGDVHVVQPAAVSITQASELGTAYRPEDVARLAALAHGRGLKLHMDGARLANAVTFLGCHPGDVTWRAGVDVLSFGATKNGAMGAEAVVFFDSALVGDFEIRRKRAGHLLSKSRYAAAQLLAYVETGVWQRNAARANELARRIGAAAGKALLHPVEANEVFLDLGVSRREALRAQGFGFYDLGPPTLGRARMVASWDQPEQDVSALCAALTATTPHQ
ncbi:MAG: low specificity L-threonine aldolase [Proteobacteria bacterium]|nr:low specificity L-threonine aldolase [Pseudomonadota bacterium]